MRSTGSNITTTAARTRTTRGEERVERTSIHPARVAGPDPSVLLLLLPLALRNRVLLVLAEEPQSGATYSSQRKDISSVEVLLKARNTHSHSVIEFLAPLGQAGQRDLATPPAKP